ncbi:hypothetical protein GGX14DRAFT_613506 [Mycena pura]|uniref:Uncharacterized protein n=1 Tax=Mycena pura TaxID=153505 RepID=A0AAD7E4K7_9AGAR|nr:hypothetical protein GGX14DRAFT_613506 [Mycena pura]
MPFTPVTLSDLEVGDIIYADVKIDSEDMADTNSKSTTAKKIKKGDPITRLAVVLVAGTASVEVTYLATFARSTTLPSSFADKSYWYPFTPAGQESIYEPLPAMTNNEAQWASLRVTQTITQDTVGDLAHLVDCFSLIRGTVQVKRIDGANIGESADLIRAAMKA